MNYRLIILLLLLSSGSTAFVHAQVQSDYDAFTRRPGARATAMGEATLADAHDMSIAFSNPAGLMFLQEVSLLMDHQRQAKSLVKAGTIGILVNEGEGGRLAMAASLEYNRSPFNTPENEIPARRLGFDAAQAVWITSSVGLGISASFLYGNTKEFQHWQFNSVIGLQYSPAPEISYAVTLQGIGTSVVSNLKERSMAYKPIPKTLSMGLAMRYPSSYEHQILTLALVNSKQFGLPGLTYRAGIEVRPVPYLALRTGYGTGPLASGLSFGSGIDFGTLELDAGISNTQPTHVYQVSAIARL